MNPHDLKLYQSNGSPNSRRVRIYLAERGICMPMIPVDLGPRNSSPTPTPPSTRARVVPTLLLEDGTAIGEVPAIWRYLEALYPDAPLMGATAKDKALATMWERRMELEGLAPAIEAVRNRADGLKGRAIAGPHGYEQIPALVERGRQRVADFHGDLDALMQDRPFVAGQAFSVADITARVAVDFAAKALDMPLPASAMAARRWHDDLSARPSIQA
ncbi:MAG: glutathione S-transferase N-terminal domain-containing protein [Caulobacteraceae bacterium]